MTIDELRETMHALEAAQEKADGSEPDFYGDVCAYLMGLEPSPELDAFLDTEAMRCVDIAHDNLPRYGVPVTPVTIAGLGIVQGITMAAAAARLKGRV